jgi:hypothetical protein
VSTERQPGSESTLPLQSGGPSAPALAWGLLALALVAAVVGGCDSVSGGGAQMRAGGDTCQRDIATLHNLQIESRACAATSECPDGSYCDKTGACSWECYSDSDCGVGIGCSCEGLCEVAVTQSAPVDSGVDCERDETTLLGLDEAPRACDYDDECPAGSHCDAATGVCSWTCLAGELATAGCAPGVACDCKGRCDSDAELPFMRPLPELSASPTSIPVPVIDGDVAAWRNTPRRVGFTLRTPTAEVAEAAAGAAVTVRAGNGLELSCSQGGFGAASAGDRSSVGQASCTLEAWTFAATGALWTATQYVWVRPAAGAESARQERGQWELTAHTSDARDAPLTVPIYSVNAPTTRPGDAPIAGEYEGFVHLQADNGGRAAGVSLPVKAWLVNGGMIQFFDPLRVLSADGRWTASHAGSGADLRYLSFGEAGRAGSIATGDLGVGVGPLTRRTFDRDAGIIAGDFALRLPGETLTARFELTRVAELQRCDGAQRCSDGYVCGEANVCVAKHRGAIPEVLSPRARPKLDLADRWVEAVRSGLPSHDSSRTRAELVLCGGQDGAGFDATKVLSISGDLACKDPEERWGGLATFADSAAGSGADAPGGGDLLAHCLAELGQEPPPVSDTPAEAAAIELIRAERDNICFQPARTFAAMDILTGDGGPAGDDSARLYLRLLQHWITVHAFVSQQTVEQHAVAQVLRSANEHEAETDAAVNKSPGLDVAMERQEQGWTLVLVMAPQIESIANAVLRSPDYRQGADGDTASEQREPLPLAMLDGASTHLRLLAAYARDALRDAYGQCYAGGRSSVRDEALVRLSRGLRYVFAVSSYAEQIYGDSDMASDWASRWAALHTEFSMLRERALALSQDVAVCRNPLYASESQVPIYFADPVGDSARFFAGSDYLLREWARPAVDSVKIQLERARTAWISQRSARVQDVLAQDEAERRAERLAAQYGARAITACGATGIEAKDALEVYGTGDGKIALANCYFDWGNEVCRKSVAPPAGYTAPIDRMTDDIAKFQLCQWHEVASRIPELREHVATLRNKTKRKWWQRAVSWTVDSLSEIFGNIPSGAVLSGLLEDVKPPDGSSVKDVARAIEDRIKVVTDALGQLDGIEFDWQNATWDDNGEVHSGGKTIPGRVLWVVDARLRLAAANFVEGAVAVCAQHEAFGGIDQPLPSDDDYRIEPSRESVAHCYRGTLGEAALGVASAEVAVHNASEAWQSAERGYRRTMEHCLAQAHGYERIGELRDRFQADMESLIQRRKSLGQLSGLISIGKGIAMMAAGGSGGAAGGSGGAAGGSGGAAGGVDAIGGLFGIAEAGMSAAMQQTQLAFESEVARIQDDMALRGCFFEAKQRRETIAAAALQVDQATVEFDTHVARFVTELRATEQSLIEGRAVLERERGRLVPRLGHHYWLSEHIDRFQEDFEWARQLVFLAMRAVEYEYQVSLGLRREILAADHPNELIDVMRALDREQFSRTINNRRPEAGLAVFSLRDELLRLDDQRDDVSGSRGWSPVQRFQSRLWSQDYAVYDDAGNYLGQGIPFTLSPAGALKLRCAERLWRVTATLQGDLVTAEASAAPIVLMRTNLFQSQWCNGRRGDSPYQTASLQPESTLFGVAERGGVEALRVSSASAALEAWFNVSRDQFDRAAYAEGASDEFAGRGLYGDYVILFPWHGLLENGFPLDQMEDVLLRFDYLSVGNLP